MGGCYSSLPSAPSPPWANYSQGGEAAKGDHLTALAENQPAGPVQLPPRVKLVLLGDSGVGKSCLALRYVKGVFTPTDSTIGAAFLTHAVVLPTGSRVRFEIWDTAGQERYHSLSPLYYRNAHAALIVFDITSQVSFDKCMQWTAELQAGAPGVVIVVVGHKLDLAHQRAVSEEQGMAFADSVGALYVEASALTGMGVGAVFETVAAQLAGGLPCSIPALAP